MTDISVLTDIMARLRDPESGCPWDIAQDFATIVPHTIEEAYEVADAIERQDFDALPDELGDLLFQVIFYARLGEEQQRFDMATIVKALADKLIRRHPHVFGDSDTQASEVDAQWESIKQMERERKAKRNGATLSALDDVPVALPATTRARKLQSRAARDGFDWPQIKHARAKLDEEVEELDAAIADADTDAIVHELGDVMFSVINVARKLGVDPEGALRAANQRFEQRFRYIENATDAANLPMADLTLAELDRYWQQAKSQQASAPSQD